MSISGTMKEGQYVYYGPNSDVYPNVGSVSSGETVNIHWYETDSDANNWYYIDYAVGTTSNRKSGYVPATKVTCSSTVPAISTIRQGTPGTRYARDDCKVYFGYDPSINPQAGSVSYGENVYFLGVKDDDNQYAFIEYYVTGSTQKKRGWMEAENLAYSRLSPTLTVGQYPSDMNIKGADYYGSNWYYTSNSALEGECTWFCWGRAQEKCGKYIKFTGGNNGGEWFDNCNYELSRVGQRAASLGPVTNSICSCSSSNGVETGSGHVIFVELVSGDTVYYTEANVGGTDGVVKSCTTANFPPDGRIAYGYLVMT